MVNLLKKKPQRTVSILTIFVIATFALELIVLFLSVFQGIHIFQLSQRKPPNFVQLINGQLITSTDDLERDPEVIRKFISKTMISMFNWSGNLPPQTIEEFAQPKPDLGILIRTTQGGRQRISTNSWIAGFALSEDFRKGFLSQIAELTPVEVFSKNPNQAISVKLIIKRISYPEKIAPGAWRISMVADIIQRKLADNRRILTAFNKDFLVRSIDNFTDPFIDQASDLQKAIYTIHNDKLEIYEIHNLCLLDQDSRLNDGGLKPCVNQQKSESFIK